MWLTEHPVATVYVAGSLIALLLSKARGDIEHAPVVGALVVTLAWPALGALLIASAVVSAVRKN